MGVWKRGAGRFLRSGIGGFIARVDAAPFRFEPIAFHHTVLSRELLAQLVMTAYEEQLKAQAFRAIFAVDVLGSPATLFRNIRQGFDGAHILSKLYKCSTR